MPGGALSSRLPTSVTGVALYRSAFPSGTVPVRGSRGDCPARKSNARPAFSTDNREKARLVMAKVFIGVDPHKLSATIEVVDARNHVWSDGLERADGTISYRNQPLSRWQQVLVDGT